MVLLNGDELASLAAFYGLTNFDSEVQIATRQYDAQGRPLSTPSGQPRLNPLAAYPARVSFQAEQVLLPTGEEAVTRAIVEVDARVPVDPACQIVLPDGSRPVIRDVQVQPSYGTPVFKRILT